MKPIISTDIKKKLKELNREDLLFHSSPATDNFLYDFVSKKQPKNIVEIGTYNGLSTVTLASIVKELVYTFDIVNRNREWMWNIFKVRHKIDNFIGTKEQIAYDINYRWNRKQIPFDFAFIDGEHTYEAVKWDFELVKRCGRVLFHDINGEEVGRFVKEIGGRKVDEIFGYWEEK